MSPTLSVFALMSLAFASFGNAALLKSGFAISVSKWEAVSSCNTVPDFKVPDNKLGTVAISQGGVSCGQCVRITGPTGISTIVKVQSATAGTANNLHLSQAHFDKISGNLATYNVGWYDKMIGGSAQVPVRWMVVPCPN